MKNLLFLLAFSVLLFSCETEDIIPPDETEYFTDITYEVTGSDDLTPDITYGSWTYSLPNYPDSLVWQELRAEDVLLPWTKTVSTCKGHPVSIGAIQSGNKGATLTFNIYDKDVLVATRPLKVMVFFGVVIWNT